MSVSEKSVYKLGIYFDSSLISVHLFDPSDRCIQFKNMSFEYPLLPGFATVSIFELIDLVDPAKRSDVVGIALDCNTDSTFKVVNSLNDSSHWFDVPLSKWIESKIGKEVYICDFLICQKYRHLAKFPQPLRTKANAFAFAAASFALERFNSFNSSFEAG